MCRGLRAAACVVHTETSVADHGRERGLRRSRCVQAIGPSGGGMVDAIPSSRIQPRSIIRAARVRLSRSPLKVFLLTFTGI